MMFLVKKWPFLAQFWSILFFFRNAIFEFFQFWRWSKMAQKWSKLTYFGPNRVNFYDFEHLSKNNIKKWPFYDRYRVFSCIRVESCKISSSRFLKSRILTFSMATFRVSFIGNESWKWPKIVYFRPNMAKIGQNGPKMAILLAFLDPKWEISKFYVFSSRLFIKFGQKMMFLVKKLPFLAKFWSILAIFGLK